MNNPNAFDRVSGLIRSALPRVGTDNPPSRDEFRALFNEIVAARTLLRLSGDFQRDSMLAQATHVLAAAEVATFPGGNS